MKTDPIWAALDGLNEKHDGFFEASAYVDLFFGWRGAHHSIRVSFYRDGSLVKDFHYRTHSKEISEDFVIRQIQNAGEKFDEYLKTDDSWQTEALRQQMKERQ